MKPLDEIFPSGRADGRKFTTLALSSHVWYEPIFRHGCDWHGIWNDGRLMTVVGTSIMQEWHPFTTKKKVTMYRPIQISAGDYTASEMWNSNKSRFGSYAHIVGWDEKEFEVDE